MEEAVGGYIRTSVEAAQLSEWCIMGLYLPQQRVELPGCLVPQAWVPLKDPQPQLRAHVAGGNSHRPPHLDCCLCLVLLPYLRDVDTI